jgi:glutamine synthetase adenylyltransferase
MKVEITEGGRTDLEIMAQLLVMAVREINPNAEAEELIEALAKAGRWQMIKALRGALRTVKVTT